MAAVQMYLVWATDHDAWWRPMARGYTTDLNEAGHYTAKVAAEILASDMLNSQRIIRVQHAAQMAQRVRMQMVAR